MCAALMRRRRVCGADAAAAALAGKDNKSKAAAAAATALSILRCTAHSGFLVVGTWKKIPCQNCPKI